MNVEYPKSASKEAFKMLSKILIGSGIFIILTSLIAVLLGIISSFQAMKFNENAGIVAVGSGLIFALISNVLFFVGLLVLLLGCIKLYRDKRSRK